MNILVTGGAGFIGSNFLNLFVSRYPEHNFINFDKLTYAANLLNLTDIESLPNYKFEQGDITNYSRVNKTFNKYNPDIVIHFAAESHVDRSILGPSEFVQTNIIGTFNLLEACRKNWLDFQVSKNSQYSQNSPNRNKLFHHVSTDEVYGSLSLNKNDLFTEITPYAPHSPYSASKASSDHLVRAYFHTYGLPVKITNCSNNYGPYQFPEKVIPLMILNAIKGKALPVYGKGENIRDWLYVEDHCEAIWTVIKKGHLGETYNIGGNNEWKNIDIVHKICEILAKELNRDSYEFKKLITFVKDRPGHDLRYAIDSSKIRKELHWQPRETFETGLRKTVRWYLNNQKWVDSIQTGEYKKWFNYNYTNR